MSTRNEQLDIRPDDVFDWLADHGWEVVETERHGTLAVHPGRFGGAIEKTRSGHVVAADVAACLGVKLHLVLQGVRAGWSPTKALFMAEGEGGADE